MGSFLNFKKDNENNEGWRESLKILTNAVNSIRYGNLTNKIENIPNREFKRVVDSINRMIETLNDREKMIVEYQNEQRHQNEFLKKVVNCLSEGVIIVDENHKILEVTSKIIVWFGQKEKEILEKDLFEFVRIKKYFKELDEDDFEIKNSPFIFTASCTELMERNKKNYVLTVRNITNQVELEKIKEDFVGTLTHDLRVPIIAELNVLELLLDGKFGELNENQLKVLKGIKTSNEDLLDLVQTLLLAYKIKNSEVYFDKQPFNLYELVKELLDETISPDKSKVEFLCETKAAVYGDRLHIKRVLKNLINNAVVHGNSEIPIKIECFQSQDWMKICVTDFGKGIPAEHITKIFDKFYSTAKKFKKVGTGLGLFISKQIVDAHGGKLTVESEENVKTTFCVELPTRELD